MRGEEPYVRRTRFANCTDPVAFSASYRGTVLTSAVEGVRGHSSWLAKYFSSFSLFAFVRLICYPGPPSLPSAWLWPPRTDVPHARPK